ncbi:MAG: pyridoxal phosphate-dependent aminotransferase [bacterium]|nr:pyridoxal phosphate-dependent aminotransferase [bacterium]
MSELLLADRVKDLKQSGIRKIFDMVPKAKNPINLTLGEPDFDVPVAIKEAAKEAIDRGFNKYTPTQGIPQLRTAVADYLLSRNIKQDEVMITAGVSGGLVLSTLALVNPGDEVLIPDPYFVMYKQMVKIAGGVPVFLDTYPNFRLTPEILERAITPRTKLLLLNSPNNPSGTVLTAKEINALVEVIKAKNLFVIADDIYDRFVYDSDHCESIAARDIDVLLLGGFSKTYAMTGWRLGYAAGPSWLIQRMCTLQQYSFTSANSSAQYACLKAFSCDISSHIANLETRRDFIYNALRELGFNPTRPEGAFYIFTPVPSGYTSQTFIEACIEKELFMIPGDAFSEHNTHFRISFAASWDHLKRGVEVLRTMVK